MNISLVRTGIGFFFIAASVFMLAPVAHGYAPLLPSQLSEGTGPHCGNSENNRSSLHCRPGDTCKIRSDATNNYTGECAESATQPTTQSGGGSPVVLPNPLGKDSDFLSLLDRFITVLTVFAAPILVALITVAGFMYMFGGADPQKRTTAVKIMKYGIIGFIVIIFARAIAAIVQGVL